MSSPNSKSPASASAFLCLPPPHCFRSINKARTNNNPRITSLVCMSRTYEMRYVLNSQAHVSLLPIPQDSAKHGPSRVPLPLFLSLQVLNLPDPHPLPCPQPELNHPCQTTRNHKTTASLMGCNHCTFSSLAPRTGAHKLRVWQFAINPTLS